MADMPEFKRRHLLKQQMQSAIESGNDSSVLLQQAADLITALEKESLLFEVMLENAMDGLRSYTQHAKIDYKDGVYHCRICTVHAIDTSEETEIPSDNLQEIRSWMDKHHSYGVRSFVMPQELQERIRNFNETSST